MTSRRYFPVKNNKNFSWDDDGTVKDRRRPNEKHYRFCLYLSTIHNQKMNRFQRKKCVHMLAMFVFNFDDSIFQTMIYFIQLYYISQCHVFICVNTIRINFVTSYGPVLYNSSIVIINVYFVISQIHNKLKCGLPNGCTNVNKNKNMLHSSIHV